MPNHNRTWRWNTDDTCLGQEAEHNLPITAVGARATLGLITTIGDGLLLRLGHQRAEYRLWGTCPDCGLGCWSEKFSDRAGFRQQTEHFQPSERHRWLNGCCKRHHAFGQRSNLTKRNRCAILAK